MLPVHTPAGIAGGLTSDRASKGIKAGRGHVIITVAHCGKLLLGLLWTHARGVGSLLVDCVGCRHLDDYTGANFVLTMPVVADAAPDEN